MRNYGKRGSKRCEIKNRYGENRADKCNSFRVASSLRDRIRRIVF